MKLPSSDKVSIAQIPSIKHPRSVFNRDFSHKTTLNTGIVYPIMCDEVVPGDTFNLKMSFFTRLNPTLAPIMDNLYFDTHFFFVPTRLVWSNFQKFMGEQENPGDSTDYLAPIVLPPTGGWAVGSNAAMMGVRPLTENFPMVSLPLRALNLIWNEWYRDENLQDSKPVPKDDGPDDPLDFSDSGFYRNKYRDYFTGALPAPQKGDAVMIPSLSSLPVTRVSNSSNPFLQKTLGTNTTNTTAGPIQANASGVIFNNNVGGSNINFDPNGSLEVNLSNNSAATINALRAAEAVQSFLELDNRGGTRYTEINRAHFGVISPDARLQRPEYLGGGSSPVHIQPITQTSEAGTTPQGNLSGIGTSSGSGNHGFIKSFVEHGYVIGLVSIRADLSYQQGLDRMWSRRTRLDYYWPSFANLGEQAVLNQELYVQPQTVTSGGEVVNTQVFGYVPRYEEMRSKRSYVSGIFNSEATASLDYWHLAEDFSGVPDLDDQFVRYQIPMPRVMAEPTIPDFLLDTFFDYKCTRPMPMFSIPQMGVRF